MLIANRGDIEWVDELKCTPLHLACKKGNIESVALLLANDSNIYAIDNRSWTPLHYASYNGNRKVCNYLLKWEADKDTLRDMKNSQNKKPINICKNPETKPGFNRNLNDALALILFYTRYMESLQRWRSGSCEDSY